MWQSHLRASAPELKRFDSLIPVKSLVCQAKAAIWAGASVPCTRVCGVLKRVRNEGQSWTLGRTMYLSQIFPASELSAV